MASETTDDPDRLLRALFDPACPRCHRAGSFVKTIEGIGCLGCGWTGHDDELETFRYVEEPIGPNTAWIILMICAGLLLGAAGWLLRAVLRG